MSSRSGRRVAMSLCLLAACLVQGAAASASTRGIQEDIERALRSSPFTYFAYANPLYWGLPVHITIRRLRVSHRDPTFAGAILTAFQADGTRASDPQRVLLRRGLRWRVARAQGLGVLECRLGAAGVIRELFGNCAPYHDIASAETFISGPSSFRPATRTERAAILAATRAIHFKHGDRCVRYHVSVSKVNPRFASVAYTPSGRKVKDCSLGNGISLFARARSGRWHEKGVAGDAFPCLWAPPGVIRSLFRQCLIDGGPAVH